MVVAGFEIVVGKSESADMWVTVYRDGGWVGSTGYNRGDKAALVDLLGAAAAEVGALLDRA